MTSTRVERNARFAAAALTAVLLVFGLIEAEIVTRAIRGGDTEAIGIDLNQYLGHAQSWLSGSGFYRAEQLTGEPYVIEDVGGNTYPPLILYVLVPFALGLPLVLWWAIPIALIVVTLWRARPTWWAWPLVAAVFVYPRTWTVVLLGNPAMWAIAAAVAGTLWGWPSIGASLKLTFAPLVLVGYGHRSWMAGVVVGLLLALPFGTMWLDYATAMLHAQSSRGLEYVLGEWPIAVALLIAAASRNLARVYSSRGRQRPGDGSAQD